jgi:hypothetical protein
MDSIEENPVLETLSLSNPEPLWLKDDWASNGWDGGIGDSLAEIEQHVLGLSGVTDLLYADEVNKMVSEDKENIAYEPLSANLRERLQCAHRALIDDLESALGELKERPSKFSSKVGYIR